MSNKTPCSAQTKAGKACKAWAIHGSNPPLCSAHAGRAGAPPGNSNAVKHGYYSQEYDDHEVASLLAHGTNHTLTDELALTRVALMRLFAFITPEDGESPMPYVYSSVLPHIFAGVRTVAALLRQMDQDDGQSPWDEILDQMSDRLNINL